MSQQQQTENFYPRPPDGGRPPPPHLVVCPLPISIHALRMEGDSGDCKRTLHPVDFYPRPPDGGRPLHLPARVPRDYFYPRPPDGGRPDGSTSASHSLGDFYPRPPDGGRLFAYSKHYSALMISIHALRMEGDRDLSLQCRSRRDFYPRPPGGGRRFFV